LLRLRSDEQLLALFRAGNDDAFRVIHDRYAARLFAYARQMLSGSRADAEDAVQDVFIRAYSALRSHDRPVALRAWLYRVAHNRCVDHLRRPAPPVDELAESMNGLTPDLLAQAERREDLRRLVADVRRLPEQQRSVLLMREMEGLSYADLAEALGVTVPAVKSLLVRARMGLVEAAEARDVECAEIRGDLALAYGRGVRANGRARRHMRDCAGCRQYRRDLRQLQRTFAGLVPVAAGPLGVLAKLTGLGSGGGAAAGGSAAAGGAACGGAAAGTGLLGSGLSAVGATKVAAVVSAVVVAGGGAVKVEQKLVHGGASEARAAPAPPAATTASGTSGPTATERRIARAIEAPVAAAPLLPAAEEASAGEALPVDGATGEADDEGLLAAEGTGGTAAPDDTDGATDDAAGGSHPAAPTPQLTNTLTPPRSGSAPSGHSGSGSSPSGSGSSGSGSDPASTSGSSGSATSGAASSAGA
jgi:RNA polymerase sigma factor (sigma-70 family)